VKKLKSILASAIQAEAEAKKIIEDAKKEAEKIIANAKRQAEEIVTKEVEKYIQQMNYERRQKVSEINLKFKEEILKAQEELYEEIIREVERRINELRNNEIYEKIINRLIIESCETLNCENVIIKIDSKDRDIKINLEEIKDNVKKRTGHDVNISVIFESISKLGGIVATTADESIIYDNTLDSIIERNKKEIIRILYKTIT